MLVGTDAGRKRYVRIAYDQAWLLLIDSMQMLHASCMRTVYALICKVQSRLLSANSVESTGKVFWHVRVNCSSRRVFGLMCNVGTGKWVLLVT